ncbi:diguanylate cyclase (GGDEF) domain-containing protein [Desulfocapsa sulfexigens DSM 10523]|uniref:diguanylate cyclase n=1 Tax=Desulfocapsa sulfexigens (strain DSM 10523 / SB164P1) TaxID=1167006 RepID=M1PUI1_DESSD|nr:GGDEF domain-containing protein [Desulfocapsa sulfexigens]AGF79971.1 diguanylate cyclase (GGDEF) domain-containing protein [Desulfocapsa sulfexigens DSM 10523]
MSIKMSISHTASIDQKSDALDQVWVELDHFRRQTERLDLMNKLHGRMAGVLDVSGMIEAYSVWLMPQVEHELVGYKNQVRSKKHLFCSGHGPKRRSIIAFAEKILNNADQEAKAYMSEDGHYAHKWLIETAEDAGILIILKNDKALSDNEISLINESLLVLAESLRRGIEYEELFESARKDALTGLANRRVFDERILDIMRGARRYHRPLTMASLDLDHFKQINDNLGHKQGDVVLKKVADIFREGIRSTDMLVRFGGDEFILVMDDTDEKSARILAERLCLAIDELNIWANSETKLGVSIGMTQWRLEENLDEWMQRVDDILYNAKSEGRSRVTVC